MHKLLLFFARAIRLPDSYCSCLTLLSKKKKQLRATTPLCSGILYLLLFVVAIPSDLAGVPAATISFTSAAMKQDTLTSTKAQRSPYTDTSTLRIRSFSPEKLAAYKKDQAFDYAEEIVPITWWQKLKHWFYNLLQKTFVNQRSFTAIKWLLVILGAAALVFLVYKLSGMQLMGIFGKKSGTQTTTAPLEENIHAINFEEQVQQAILQQNFRLAVRLLYLRSLKKLTDKHLIDWRPGKTNQAYIAEIDAKPTKTAFIGLTNQFEYVWYGDFQIQSQHFNQIREAFASFDKELI
ncbi:DUF4129 domain-containing protein [Olivibacter sp. SDN3]|uniref:DUF4129 domain-containing protein n=1 Tax=Olivibacter sp. SDN3 TaxID=2764720 RepID=UPI0016517107|nr:DUF4129 domain-containing protein [Olivibacter sp. SDN3]QNL50662.1 DUF4129 domain-containing protein [Olivibacter sp. SDN3]